MKGFGKAGNELSHKPPNREPNLGKKRNSINPSELTITVGKTIPN
jgi:hypothetical protein